MANSDLMRLGKRALQYFYDPLPPNEDPSQIWCLGRSYDSRYRPPQSPKATGTSPSAHSDSSTSQADSAVVTGSHDKDDDEPVEINTDELLKSQADLTRSQEEALGWPAEFVDDLESRIWLTYRRDMPLIPKSSAPAPGITFATRLRNIANSSGYTDDSGWGCMIRSGQSLLANAISILKLGRDWRLGEKEDEHKDLLSLFADSPDAPFSIHKFVEHGADACGKHPGEWFGPNATVRCIEALTNRYAAAGLRVYANPHGSDIYADSLFATASQKDADDNFKPTLIVLGVRIGIDRITPVYHAALKRALETPQCVGIAGGRPNTSHYFVGHQSDQFFYLDPHSTRAALSAQPTNAEMSTCHTRRVRRLSIAEMDPSMLIGFLIHSRQDFEEWRKALSEADGKAIVHVHDQEPKMSTGMERESAVDEVETWDETGEDDAGDES